VQIAPILSAFRRKEFQNIFALYLVYRETIHFSSQLWHRVGGDVFLNYLWAQVRERREKIKTPRSNGLPPVDIEGDRQTKGSNWRI